MTYVRILQLDKLLAKNSFFLFGPRAVGKSFLIHKQLSDKAQIIDLLNSDIYLRLSQSPHHLEAMIQNIDQRPWVVIDEVQKLPSLLDEVHRLIETKGLHFLLTGSSARKLKRGKANMLAGRAYEARMHPLSFQEIEHFDLERYLLFGGLPNVYDSNDPLEALNAYINTYLREEIQAEAIVRNLPAFSRFLEMAALTSGTIMNFSKISSDTGIPVNSVREYYFALEDTFIGFMLQPYQKTQKRKPIQTAKFYFFDPGVSHFLARITNLPQQSDLYGNAFEHFIAMELTAYLSYHRKLQCPLTFWKEKNGKEVDFIMGDEVAVEVKSSERIHEKHLKSLRYFMEESLCKRHIVVSHDKIAMHFEGIETLHWQDFLEQLWSGQII